MISTKTQCFIVMLMIFKSRFMELNTLKLVYNKVAMLPRKKFLAGMKNMCS